MSGYRAWIGFLVGLCCMPFLNIAAEAQVRCVRSGPSGTAVGVGSTCSVETAVAAALNMAEGTLIARVKCPAPNFFTMNTICRRQGLVPDFNLFPGERAAPSGYYRAISTGPQTCLAFKQNSRTVFNTAGFCPKVGQVVAKINVTGVCGVLCRR
jgi:hypothetical protein